MNRSTVTKALLRALIPALVVFGSVSTTGLSLQSSRLALVGPNTITLPNCPKGLSTNDHFLYIAGTGIPEAVKVTVVNCTPGAGGTISLVATSVHGDGYTISSATGGIKEAWEDAHGVLVLPPGHIATMYAPLHLEKSNAYMDLSGATLVCNVPNN